MKDQAHDKPTSFPGVNKLLRLLQSDLHDILGDNLIGLYLSGSLVLGDFEPNVSDIDLTVALESDIDDREFGTLRRMHASLDERYPAWNDRIEICYVPVDALRNIRTDRRMIVNISPGEPFHWTPLRGEWLVNWYALREHHITLYGPNPSELIEPISQEEFIQCLAGHARSWSEWIHDMRRRQQQAYAILSMCRAFYGIRHGHQASKQRAAHWVAQALPEWTDLINRALVWRITPEGPCTDHDATFSDTERFINSFRGEISDVVD